MAEERRVNDEEKHALRDFLVRLFEPMSDSKTVALYATTVQDRDTLLRGLGPEFVSRAEETLRELHDPEILETWNRQLTELAARSLDDNRFRQTAAALLRDLELSLAEAWLRARFESWLPLAAMFGLDSSKVDIENEVRNFLNVLRVIPMDAGASPALTALGTADSQAMRAVQIGLGSITTTPEDWYGDYCTDPVYGDTARWVTSIAGPQLALPLLGITFCDDRQRTIPSRYHWTYRATDWGGSIAMRWTFYRLLEPRQTQAMLRRITYASARDNDMLIPNGRPHWIVRDATIDPGQDERDDEERLAEAEELYNCGVILQNEGHLPDALKSYEAALALVEEGEYPQLEAMAVGNLGNTYRDLGQVDKALALHQRRLSIERAIGPHGNEEGEGRALAYLGLDYRAIGDVKTSKRYFADALKHLRTGSALDRQVREWLAELR